jgi:urea carboxylase
VRVVSGGLASSIQDYPGRLGYWAVGVPPSGPMDALALRLGNRLLGNSQGAAGLEWTAVGPTLQFENDAVVCIAGASSLATLDGAHLERYGPLQVCAGQTLKVGRLEGPGLRGYVLFRGGIDVPAYLGSGSTFLLGGFGGHAGRNLASGDVLKIAEEPADPLERALPRALQPQLAHEWTVRVLYGPHGAPDFFTEEDIEVFLQGDWRVHHHSNRTGVRLIGPRPRWARRNGGEAGLHPSNIHDNPYAIGAVDFTGDMPIILGPDGPSLGGFVCPFVVIQADLWKLGQLTAGDIVRFRRVDLEEASLAEHSQDALIAHLRRTPGHIAVRAAGADLRPGPILAATEESRPRPRTEFRRQGDRYLLVEYGPPVLDLELRLRVHALMEAIERLALPGVIDVTPGIRSLQVHYDPRQLKEARLLAELQDADDDLGTLDAFEMKSRVVHLPLSFRDPAVEETIARYMASVRADAPWCPDNIEFIRRVNGLESQEEVRRIVFDASYLVMGLGDVYLGAPVAIPVDPRHRLVTTKYNPARTWTPPNVVGIGGAYLCIYGLEGPGGYQLFGRTIQVWNDQARLQPAFEDGKPWLLRFFDQLRFFPVSHGELAEWRREFPTGARTLRVETEVFRLADYRAFLARHREGIDSFQAKRQAAFDAECRDWELRNELARAEVA